MTTEEVQDPVRFLASLGDLHDVEIERVEFYTGDRLLTLNVHDLNANFTETPDYQGHRPCVLLFQGVRNVVLDVETSEGIRISSAEILKDAAIFRLDVDLNLGGGSMTRGRRSISATFEWLQIREGGHSWGSSVPNRPSRFDPG